MPKPGQAQKGQKILIFMTLPEQFFVLTKCILKNLALCAIYKFEFFGIWCAYLGVSVLGDSLRQ